MKTVDRAKIWAYNTRYTENEEEAYDIIGDLLKERQDMHDAALALYMAGRWSCDQVVDEATLWEILRDAMGIPKGTETQRAKGE